MIWPINRHMDVFFGTSDGHVRQGFFTTHKSQILFQTQSPVLSIVIDNQLQTIYSAHLDCSIYSYNAQTKNYQRLITHSCVPMAFTGGRCLAVSGMDKKITIYSLKGELVKKFDYTGTELKDFTIASSNSSGETLIFGSYSSFVVLQFNQKNEEWQQQGKTVIENYYIITAMRWK